MNHFSSPELFISAKTKALGVALIKTLYISKMARLAFFLDVNPCFDGHEAVFIWIEHYLESDPDAEFSDLHRAFVQCVPEY